MKKKNRAESLFNNEHVADNLEHEDMEVKTNKHPKNPKNLFDNPNNICTVTSINNKCT